MQQIAICFLTVRPVESFYRFCVDLQRKLTAAAGRATYEVFLCVDDNTYDIPGDDGSLEIIRLDPKIPEQQGFKSSVLYFDGKACSRDKALYYFSRINPRHKYVWFIEDDVFVPGAATIKALDERYPVADLLVAEHKLKWDMEEDWHWAHIFKQMGGQRLPPPYAISMICAMRASRRLLAAVSRYAAVHRNLFMDEALFNTLALKEGLVVVTPAELSTIRYRADWTAADIRPTHMYHPVKDMDEQVRFRRGLGL